jgi:hypothetical protein
MMSHYLTAKIVHQVTDVSRIIERHWESVLDGKQINFYAQKLRKFLFFHWWVNCEEIDLLRDYSGECGECYIPVAYTHYKDALEVLTLQQKQEAV